MKKRDKILIIVGLVCIGIYILLKMATINQYRMGEYYWNPYAFFRSSLTIKTKEDNKNVLVFQGLQIKNYFNGFKTSNFNEPNVKYDKKGNAVAYYAVQAYPQYIKVLNEKAFELYAEGEEIPDYFTGKSMQKYLDKNNIKSDIDLIRHIKTNYYFRSNILTPVSQIKNNAILNAFVDIVFLEVKEIVLLEGDLNGYIMNFKNNPGVIEIHLIRDDFHYGIILNGEEVTTEDFIIKLLESVKYVDINTGE